MYFPVEFVSTYTVAAEQILDAAIENKRKQIEKHISIVGIFFVNVLF